MRYEVLGPLQVRRDLQGEGVAVVELGPPKQRALLALLVMHAGELVSADQIIDRLWRDRAPRTAAHSVQVYVSDLRRRLGGVGDDPIQTRSGGYLLKATADQVDAREFEQLVRSGRQALEEDRPKAAAASLVTGLNLWRGPVLADLASQDFAQEHIQVLDGLRLDAMEALADARLALGDDDGALSILSTAIPTDPLRERPRALLMLALYRLGRHAAALRAYQHFAHRLADELGIDPSPALRQLHQRVLLHDPRLGRATPSEQPATRNPYKGLRPFAAHDAGDFFGREALVERVLDELRLGSVLVTLVGPSGSGKSSTLAAGVLPRVQTVLPGYRPMPVSMDLAGVDLIEGLAVDRTDPVLLVLDQMEELFSQPEPALSGRYLRCLSHLLSDPTGAVQATGTLRADFYDRPLQYPGIADIFLAGAVTVLPLTASELRQAIVEPAARVGTDIEPALVAELVGEAVGRPGALPLLQYALTELFDRSGGTAMTSGAYRDIGGLSGALQRRAERLFLGFSEDEQYVAMHLLLRLVRVHPGGSELRRRVPVSELTDTGLDPVHLSSALHQLVAHRLLSLDRDTATGEATLELAHESLLREWRRYATWVDQHRGALAGRDALRQAVEEWDAAGRHPDFLLRGRRLTRFTGERAGIPLPLTGRERDLIDASVAERTAETASAAEAAARARARHRRERVRFAALVTATVVAAGAATATLVTGQDAGPRVALLFHDAGTEVDQQVRAGFDRGVADHGLDAMVRSATPVNAAQRLERIAAQDPSVVLAFTVQTPIASVARRHPNVQFVVSDRVVRLPNVTSIVSLDEEGAFLAGAAAALTSQTGTVGFIGGVVGALIGRFEAGYIAGARAVAPDIKVLATYLSRPPDLDGFVDVKGAEEAARAMYRGGADVIFAAAGQSGLGVFEAAADLSGPKRGHLWAIGVDTDQYQSVQWLPGVVEPSRWQHHILTSVTKSTAQTIKGVLTDIAHGRLRSGQRRVGLATGAVDLAYSGGHLAGIRDDLEVLRERIIRGTIIVPSNP